MSALESIMRHVYHLSVEIGPRGSCTPAEAEAARYAESVYRGLDLKPTLQPIVSARSAWSGYVAIAGLGLLAEVILLANGRVGAYIALLVDRGPEPVVSSKNIKCGCHSEQLGIGCWIKHPVGTQLFDDFTCLEINDLYGP